jgi:hypothetical protein
MGFALYGTIEAVLSGDSQKVLTSVLLLLFLIGGVFIIEKKFAQKK